MLASITSAEKKWKFESNLHDLMIINEVCIAGKEKLREEYNYWIRTYITNIMVY
jgi:hypothetical protein